MKPAWNKIDFKRWALGAVSVGANRYDGDTPIWLELEGDGYEIPERAESFSPEDARAIAKKLIEAADAVDAAGRT